MVKKDLSEIKKLFAKKTCRVDRIAQCYVSHTDTGTQITVSTSSASSLPEEDFDLMLGVSKKALSGKIGKNQFNVAFPNDEEKDGGKQRLLVDLLDSQLENPDLIKKYLEMLFAHDAIPEANCMVQLAYGCYDVPAKASDGAVLEYAGDTVYAFIQTSVCPVAILKPALVWNGKSFEKQTQAMAAGAPICGFLFPAYDNRSSNIHAILYYSRNEANRYQEFAQNITGVDVLPVSESAQKQLFASMVEQTLGRDCDFESVRDISKQLNQLATEQADSVDSDPATADKADLRRVIQSTDSGQKHKDDLDGAYEEMVGDGNVQLETDNIVPGKTLKVESPAVKLAVSGEYADLLVTKIVDGRECILLPIEDKITVNGIRILPHIDV